MKRLFALALFFLCSVAFAQCVPYGYTGGTASQIKPGEATVATCTNSSLLSKPTIRHNNGGFVVWNYCNDGFSYAYHFGVIKNETINTPSFFDAVLSMQSVLAADAKLAMATFRETYLYGSIQSPELIPIWCPAMNEIVANKPAPIPYVVQPYGTSVTRSTYPITKPFGGARSGTSNGKVNVKDAAGVPTPCNCMLGRISDGSTKYCSVKDVALTVAACVPK